jgi:hypothetical protein
VTSRPGHARGEGDAKCGGTGGGDE